MIKVLHPGILNTIQDNGRFGYAKLGVPFGGAMDQTSSLQANLLLNNHKNDAVIEVTFGQGKFEFTENLLLCLTGANYSPMINNQPIKMNTVYDVEKNSVLSFGVRKFGARTYIGVQGGIQSEIFMNSRSYLKGFTESFLSKNQVLTIKPKVTFTGSKIVDSEFTKNIFDSAVLEVYKGPEFDALSKTQQEQLFNPFSISEDNNRVGYRLQETLSNNCDPILTSSVLPGSVQLTPSGKLIVLMRDGQVTGGYPRVLQLSEIAINRLAQKIANDKIIFKLINF